MGGGLGENGYVCMWLSAFTVHLKLPQRCSRAIPQYKIKSLKFGRKKEIIFLLELKRKKKSEEKAVGLLKFYWTGQQNYVATNTLYSLRKRKYNPKLIQGSSGPPAPFQRVGPLLPFLQAQSLGVQSAGKAVGVMLRPRGPGRRNIFQ